MNPLEKGNFQAGLHLLLTLVLEMVIRNLTDGGKTQIPTASTYYKDHNTSYAVEENEETTGTGEYVGIYLRIKFMCELPRTDLRRISGQGSLRCVCTSCPYAATVPADWVSMQAAAKLHSTVSCDFQAHFSHCT